MSMSTMERISAPWASLITAFSLLLIFVVRRSVYVEDSSEKLIGNLRSSFIPSAEDTMEMRMKRLILGQNMGSFEAVGFICQTEQNSEQCITSNLVRIGNSTTIYIIPSSSGSKSNETTTRIIKPYTLKNDATAMKRVTPLQILESNLEDTSLPICQYNHTVPAVVFSSGGFLENMFHQIDEFLIPLFLTTQQFKSEIQFFITDYNPEVVDKYSKFLRRLSKFEPIDSSKNGTSTHCFPGAIIGLNYHGNVAVNYSDIPSGYTMTDFRRFLYESYNLKPSDMETRPVRDKPLLVFTSRAKSRALLNENEVVRLIQDVGFQVHVALVNETSDVEQFAHLLSTCDVLAGVHGAGLSNSVFLPEGAVLLQVVPLGLLWPGRHTYGDPATRMGLKHVEYVIEPKESSLLEAYGPDDPVILDPDSVFAKGYTAGRAVYIDGQNVSVNLDRFKVTLVEVLQIVKSSGQNTTEVLEHN